MVLDDRRIKVRNSRGYEHVKRTCLSHIKSTFMRKLSTRWVPRLLTLDQKRVRKNFPNALSAQFMRNKSEFWRRLITVDELGYTIIRPKQKYSPNSGTAKGGTGLKKSKKCVFSCESDGDRFWDSHGVILIDYLQKEKNITRVYHTSLLDKRKAELARKWPHFQKKRILFHQDNASSHTSAVAMVKVHE
ncbi:histone-lysine N-methyltransferase SETMAR [Trichonephila clavipes]|nr:histone-lysine N-methyltransferase SETMAR [Trichonephila clavipes]